MRQLPVVGIVGHGYVVPKFFGDLAVTGTPDKYVERVAAAGGRPVVLPGGAAVGLLDVVDALVLTGGGDDSERPGTRRTLVQLCSARMKSAPTGAR
jgi:gamma-glutamyl-gamma-aminobutyrate hydrolase PuuD